MGHRFSKSSTSSHVTSTTQTVNTGIARNSAPSIAETSSIAIPIAQSQEINFEIEEYPITAQHNHWDNSSLSSTSSNCRRFIIKIQLAKMENNGNEHLQSSLPSHHHSSSHFSEECLRSDNNANQIVDVNTKIVNVTMKRNIDSDSDTTMNPCIEITNDIATCKTAGSFLSNSTAEAIAHNIPHRHAGHCELADKLEQGTSKCRDVRNCCQLSSKSSSGYFLKHRCSNCTPKQYTEPSNNQDSRNLRNSRDPSPIALTAASSDISSSLSASEQLSIWTPSSNDVLIQSPQFVVLCPSASLVTVGRVNENLVRSVVGTEVVAGADNCSSNGNAVTTHSFQKTASNGVIVHSQVDFVHYLVPDLDKITNSSFYWGKMDRYEAERLLEGKPEGTFLLRDSAQEEFLFSVTFRKYGRSLHARIEQSGHKFSFDCHDPCVFTANTVTGLLEHYKDPACVMFFEPMLTVPLHRTSPFSLQQLCRATIVSNITYDGINKLELPMRLKSYLKEYHYKQKLRTKPCDDEFFMSI